VDRIDATPSSLATAEPLAWPSTLPQLRIRGARAAIGLLALVEAALVHADIDVRDLARAADAGGIDIVSIEQV